MPSSSDSFSGYQGQRFDRCRDDQSTPKSEVTDTALLVEEIPLAISVNGIAYAVMMVTPVQIDAFVVGFARSEGIIEHINEVRDIVTQKAHSSMGIDSLSVDLVISPRRLAQFKQRKQTHLGATGCGLCGIESLAQAMPELPLLPASDPIQLSILTPLRQQLNKFQILGNQTGAVHAALLMSPTGDPIICMEDIGRHNALDKIIGYALQHNIALHNHSVLMSSRCSTELVQKAVRVGLSRLIHFASPSTLAVQLAIHYGLTLIHLPKQDAPRIFAHTLKTHSTYAL